jgi:hypothetical protein
VKDGETAIRKYYSAAYLRNTAIEDTKKRQAVQRKRDKKISSTAKIMKKLTKLCMVSMM